MTPREELEARLTALLLGELPADEAAALRQTLAQDAELARLHDRLQQTIALVRETISAPEHETDALADAPKLSAERREKLLASLKIDPAKKLRPLRLPRVNWGKVKWREHAALAAMFMALLAIGAMVMVPSLKSLQMSAAVGESDSQGLLALFERRQARAQRVTTIAGYGLGSIDEASPESESKARMTPAQQLGDEVQISGQVSSAPKILQDGSANFTLNTPPVSLPAPAVEEQLTERRGRHTAGIIALPSVGDAVQPASEGVSNGRELERVAGQTQLAQSDLSRTDFDASGLGIASDGRRTGGMGGGGGGFQSRFGNAGAVSVSDINADKNLSSLSAEGDAKPATRLSIKAWDNESGGRDMGGPLNFTTPAPAPAATDLAAKIPEARFGDRNGTVDEITLQRTNGSAGGISVEYFNGEAPPLALLPAQSPAPAMPLPAIAAASKPASIEDNIQLKTDDYTWRSRITNGSAAVDSFATAGKAFDPAPQNKWFGTTPAGGLALAGVSDQQAPRSTFAGRLNQAIAQGAPVNRAATGPESAVNNPVPAETAGVPGVLSVNAVGYINVTNMAVSQPLDSARRLSELDTLTVKPDMDGDGANRFFRLRNDSSFTADAKDMPAEAKKAAEVPRSEVADVVAPTRMVFDAPPVGQSASESMRESGRALGEKTALARPAGGEVMFDAEGDKPVNDPQRASRRPQAQSGKADGFNLDVVSLSSDKSLEGLQHGQHTTGVETTRRRVEIALPEGERSEAKEKLQVASGPVVVNEVMYSDPATGLPVPGQTGEASVEESFNRQLGSHPIPNAYARTNVVNTTRWNVGATAKLPTPQNGPARRLAKPSDDPANASLGELAQLDSELKELHNGRDRLQQRAWQERVDIAMPKTGIVELIEKADAEPSPNPSLWGRIRGTFSRDTERTARLAVEKDATDIEAINGSRAATGFDPFWAQSQVEKIQSKTVLNKVIEKLNLNEEWAGKQGGAKLSTDDAVQLLKKRLDVRTDQKSALMDIKVKGDTAEESARIANTIAEVYRETRLERWRAMSSDGLQAMEGKMAEQNKKIAEIARAKEEIEKRSEYERLLAIYTSLSNYSHEELKRTITTASPDAALADLLAEQAVTEQRIVKQTETLGQEHPDVKQLRGEWEATNRRIDERMDGITKGLKVRVETARNELAKLSGSVPPPIENAAPVRRLAVGAPVPQPEVSTTENAFSTFSLNVSDVSFKLAAASLEKGQMPDAATVRSEEFINAFDYRDPEPKGSAPIAFAWERARYPFAHDRDLLRFSVKTAASGRQPGRPLNLVLLLDNSGSMERADRVRIRQECLRVLAGQLRPEDRVSVVAFARTARLWVDGLPGSQAGELAQRVGGLAPDGGTNLEDAMNVAYQTALKHFLPNGVNRVVLLTDGAANLGNVQPESLKKKVEAHRQQGVALDCFGIGWDGLNDELLEALSRNGDGRYGFVNTPEAATTEFASQLAGALKVAASDVKVQVEWNPRRVTAYRQIGYAKHQLKKEQFRDNKVDAAEIGAAEAGNALYTVQVNPRGEGPLGTVRVRFKVPGTSDYREHEWPLAYDGSAKSLDQSSPALRLAASASAFSEWLVSSPFAAEVTPDKLLGYLGGVPETWPADPRPKKLEWMVRQAKSVAGK